VAGIREALDICDLEASLLLNLYKMAHYELAVDKWDNFAEVILRAVNFDQTRPNNVHQSFWGVGHGGIMAVPKNDKHKEYARYAAHCLNMVTAAKEQESRSIQGEMAAEWLKLADAVRRPLKRRQMQTG
jgi:hypothetical protein